MRSDRCRTALRAVSAALLSAFLTLSAAALPRTARDRAPVAKNAELTTYRGVSAAGSFRAVDPEGGRLTYQITSAPAKGSAAVAEDGTGGFFYTPYDRQTGKDSFTYVAVDPAGNVSNPARVTVRIERSVSGVVYADMAGSSAHRAAVRLADAGILVGERVSGQYFFRPDAQLTRGQFLVMSMAAAGLEPMLEVGRTGFADDEAIPAWVKGHVSSALRAGAICGMRSATGLAVFRPEEPVTRGQAAVMLDRLLNVSGVAAESWGALGINAGVNSHWAMAAAVDLAAAGIMDRRDAGPDALDRTLTRAEAAVLLDGALDVLAARQPSGWSLW